MLEVKVFIDTNILLDIYHLSGPDLQELSKLKKVLQKGKKIELLLSSQVIDEFWRNRERVIADALRRFRETKAEAQIPNIVRSYAEVVELRAAVERVKELVRVLSERLNKDIAGDALQADTVIQDLLSAFPVHPIPAEVVDRARRRMEIGSPPGKRDSLGDAINWEWLLDRGGDFGSESLVLVSSDGDFESELTKGRPREYLSREWKQRNPSSSLRLMKSLQEFLRETFPDIQLMENAEKDEAIRRLEESWSFAATHNAVAGLADYADFNDAELRRLYAAFLNNSQVFCIVGDDDVKELIERIVPQAKSPEAKKSAEDVKALLEG